MQITVPPCRRARHRRVRPLPRATTTCATSPWRPTTTSEIERRFVAADLPRGRSSDAWPPTWIWSATPWRCGRPACSRTPSISRWPASTRPTCCPTTTPTTRSAWINWCGRSSGLRLHLPHLRQELLQGHPVPPRGREDGGDHPEDGRVRATAAASTPTSPEWPARTTSTPRGPLAAEDGVVAVALGLGRTVVDGGRALSFSPRHPQHLLHFSTVEDMLANSQRDFIAVEMEEDDDEVTERHYPARGGRDRRDPRPGWPPPTARRTTPSTTASPARGSAWSASPPSSSNAPSPSRRSSSASWSWAAGA